MNFFRRQFPIGGPPLEPPDDNTPTLDDIPDYQYEAIVDGLMADKQLVRQLIEEHCADEILAEAERQWEDERAEAQISAYESRMHDDYA